MKPAKCLANQVRTHANLSQVRIWYQNALDPSKVRTCDLLHAAKHSVNCTKCALSMLIFWRYISTRVPVDAVHWRGTIF